MEFISKLDIFDFVVLSHAISAVSIIKKIKPKIYCKGPDYKNHKEDITGNISKEVAAIKACGGKIVYTDDETFSSSQIINSVELKNEKIKIRNLKKNINIDSVFNGLKKVKNSKVLVLGETIIDEYIFCEAIGKSGKEPVLVMHDKYTEKYLGGVGAVANHIGSFCNNVTLMSFIGDNNEQLNFINRNLQKHIKKIFFKKDNSPTIIKKRYLDEINQNKVLGVYSMNDSNLTKKNENQIPIS